MADFSSGVSSFVTAWAVIQKSTVRGGIDG